ncbi:MAG: nicotinate phosphoribosyltransferase [Acidobacteriota bacterium]
MSAPLPLLLDSADLCLATDLYQLTMAAAYERRRQAGEEEPRATFELWVRRFPNQRNFLVFAGLDQALAALQRLRFGAEQLDYLRSLPAFADVERSFFDTLAEFRFQGDVRALPEGTIFFPGAPVMSVHGSFLEAQIVETLLLSIVNFQSSIASKAARLRLAAGSRARLAEFGGRRAHGPQAATWAARAAFVGGFDATSNLLAGQREGIPVVGTMAHSFVMSFQSEVEAFRHYHEVFPQQSILLVDTYDSLTGVRRALSTGLPFRGIRLDSGDLGELAREARQLLDGAGRSDAEIFVSGDLDERRIAELRAAGAPIDAFGVGTELSTSADAPALSGVYKLVESFRGGRRLLHYKGSRGKVSYPGLKQVVRTYVQGVMEHDRVVPAGEREPTAGAGRRLLRAVMRQGEVIERSSAAEGRRRCLEELETLPLRLRSLEPCRNAPYRVEVDQRLVEALECLETH